MSEHLSNAMSKERYHQNCIIRYIFDFVKNIYKKKLYKRNNLFLGSKT